MLSFLNFSIVSHEITHAFDNIASNLGKLSETSKRIYDEHVQCLIEHYSNYRVADIETFYKIDEFHLNGNLTNKEDIADCGGISLALNAFKKYSTKIKNSREIPVGFEDFTKEKIFFLSFAQTFCSVERPAKMKNRVESDVHSLNRFRVLGPLSNLPEFAQIWNCPAGSVMNPEKKCTVW